MLSEYETEAGGGGQACDELGLGLSKDLRIQAILGPARGLLVADQVVHANDQSAMVCDQSMKWRMEPQMESN